MYEPMDGKMGVTNFVPPSMRGAKCGICCCSRHYGFYWLPVVSPHAFLTMKTETRNFNIVSAFYEEKWGYPLISGHTYVGGTPVATFVAFDGEPSVSGYGDTLSEAIINLEENLRHRLSEHCNVAE